MLVGSFSEAAQRGDYIYSKLAVFTIFILFATAAFAETDTQDLQKDDEWYAVNDRLSANFCTKEKMPFNKRTYFFLVPNQKIELYGIRKPMLFEVNLSVPLPVMYLCPRRLKNENVAHRFQLIAGFDSIIRMTKHQSTPVATPSYNPYAFVAYELRLSFAEDRIKWSDYIFNFRFAPYAHHSNGQDGGSFYDADGEQTSDPRRAVRLNTDNGSFSTNYLEWSLHNRFRGWFSPRWHWLWDIQGGFQRHHSKMFGGLNMATIGPLWGQNHIWWKTEFHLGYSRFRRNKDGKFRQERSGLGNPYLSMGGHYVLLDDNKNRTQIKDIPDRRHIFELGWLAYKKRQFGIFVRVVTGRDYYNIRFAEEKTFVQMGFATTIMRVPGLPRNKHLKDKDVFSEPVVPPFQDEAKKSEHKKRDKTGKRATGTELKTDL